MNMRKKKKLLKNKHKFGTVKEKVVNSLFNAERVNSEELKQLKDDSNIDTDITVENIISANNGVNMGRVEEQPKETVHQPLEFLEKISVASKVSMPLSDVREILTRIYADCITEQEIKYSDINNWKKEMLLIAYYEKNNKKRGIQVVKDLKKKYIDSTYKTKILNILYDNINTNKIKIFQLQLYEEFLGVEVDTERAIVLMENKKEEDSNIIEEVRKEKVEPKKEEVIKKEKKVKDKPVMVGVTGTLTNRFNNEKANSNNGNNTNSSNSLNKEIVLIGNVFEEEIIELKKYVYVEMNNFNNQKDAIKAWDIIESIALKPINDKQALTKFIELLKRLEKYEQIKSKIDTAKLKKYTKYIEK